MPGLNVVVVEGKERRRDALGPNVSAGRPLALDLHVQVSCHRGRRRRPSADMGEDKLRIAFIHPDLGIGPLLSSFLIVDVVSPSLLRRR